MADLTKLIILAKKVCMEQKGVRAIQNGNIWYLINKFLDCVCATPHSDKKFDLHIISDFKEGEVTVFVFDVNEPSVMSRRSMQIDLSY